MQVKGQVVSVEFDVAVAKNGGGSYQGARFSYRDEAGALKEKGFHNNVFKFNAVLKTQLSNLNSGDKFIMDIEKENDFWNVKNIVKDTGQSQPQQEPAAPASKGSIVAPYTPPKSTYETSEERALRRAFEEKKQRIIVRQSTFTAALTMLGAKAKQPSDVFPMAREIEKYVFHGLEEDFDDGMPMSMKNDSEGIV